MKRCKHCGNEKPLTVEHWLPRKESKDGFRGTCRECWYAQQRPNKRRHYANHAEEMREKERNRRKAEPEKYKLKDLDYYLRNKEKRNAYNHEYHRRNSERLTAAAINRRNRKMSLDYGWTKALPHDRIQLKLWKDRMYAELCRCEACEFVETLEKRLSPKERTLIDCLVDANFDQQCAAEMAGVTMQMFSETLTGIKQVAVKIKTEWIEINA